MESNLSLQIKWEDLVNNGLNIRAKNIKPLIDRHLFDLITLELRKRFPRIKQQPWHYVSIRYSVPTEIYYIEIAPGWAKPVG